jgi:hypothetical protein
MADFTDIVPVGALLDRAGIEWVGHNFEEIYSQLAETASMSHVLQELESAVYQYFTSLCLPADPTIYDYLVLLLRKKDVIATFNWDPFLIQAIQRNSITRDEVPHLLFLHSNVMAGYCHRHAVHGVAGDDCQLCGEPLSTSRLLFPTRNKNYEGW